MKWILLIYFGSNHIQAQSGFAVEFDSIQACKTAYENYVANRPRNMLGSMTGICVKKR